MNAGILDSIEPEVGNRPLADAEGVVSVPMSDGVTPVPLPAERAKGNDRGESATGLGRAAVVCFHCGEPCRDGVFTTQEKAFCCRGCLTVFELLTENGLADFYTMTEGAGVKVKSAAEPARYSYMDSPAVREKLVDFSDAHSTRVTFRAPAIHCIACVWVLENLFRLKPGIGASRVPR